jgi:hypothetical protein
MVQLQKEIHSGWPLLKSSKWLGLIKKHEKDLNPILLPYFRKRSAGEKNPVIDFLFEYYRFRHSHLMSWSPGIGIRLEKAELQKPDISELQMSEESYYIDPKTIPESRINSFQRISEVLTSSSEKPPSFGCFGMHEWAMVYNAENVRHSYLSLRMPKHQIAEFVESRPLVCTHFDAYRFFTADAKPLNKYDPNRQNFSEFEQSGCIHTNMDLYKWAFKGYPWISSELIREAFFLALEARAIDMKASPYDLQDYGYQPIRIETENGRHEYLEKQKLIHKKSQNIRTKLILAYGDIIQCFNLQNN